MEKYIQRKFSAKDKNLIQAPHALGSSAGVFDISIIVISTLLKNIDIVSNKELSKRISKIGIDSQYIGKFDK